MEGANSSKQEKRRRKVDEMECFRIDDTNYHKLDDANYIRADDSNCLTMDEKECYRVDERNCIRVDESECSRIEDRNCLRIDESDHIRLDKVQVPSDTDSSSPIPTDSMELESVNSPGSMDMDSSPTYSSFSASGSYENESRCEGFLRKRYSTSRYMASWRFFVLRGNRLLWYLTKRHARQNFKVRGEIEVAQVIPWDGNGRLHRYTHSFGVKTSRGEILHCCAASEEEKSTWITALQHSLQYKVYLSESQTPLPSDVRNTIPGVVGTSTAVAAAIGAVIGTAIYPLVGSVVGAALGGSVAHYQSKQSSRRTMRAAAARRITPTNHVDDSECNTCQIAFRFGSLTRHYCLSCGGSFCKEHISHKIIFPQLGYTKPEQSCDRCFRRQDFINYMFVLSNYRAMLLDHGGASKALEKCSVNELVGKMLQRKLYSKSFSLLEAIGSLLKYRHDPILFVMILERLPLFVELQMNQVEMYWFQIIHIFQAFPPDINVNALQIFYLDRFVRAVCRRSTHIALQTVWHIQAAYEGTHGHGANCVLALLASVHPIDNHASSLWSDVIFKDSPRDQRKKMLEDINHCQRVTDLLSECENTAVEPSRRRALITWLNARDCEEFEQACLLVVENKKMSNDLCVKSKIDYSNGIHYAFEEQVRFITAMTSISERLRFVQPTDRRKGQLPYELEGLKKFIHMHSYIPICHASDPLTKIVDIPVHEGTVFSTRARAPTLICFEVIPTHHSNASLESRCSRRSYLLESSYSTSNIGSSSLRDSDLELSRSSSEVASSSDELPLITLKDKLYKYHEKKHGICASDVFGESWKEKKERIKKQSSFGDLPGWDLVPIIVKTNDDMRQEVFALQLLRLFQTIFDEFNLDLWIRPYRIISTGANTGIVETITDAISIDHLNKTCGGLLKFFNSLEEDKMEEFKRNFISSMAAYSIISYILSVKDRHNGNILLDSEGHIIHIDFGFILGIAPGGIFSVEDSPFKLTVAMVEVMGGLKSVGYQRYVKLISAGLSALRQRSSEIIKLIRVTAHNSLFPCFVNGSERSIIKKLTKRLKLRKDDFNALEYSEHLINKSYNAWGTRKYDSFQLASNGIAF